ncbi:bifunctional nuclease family protein [Spirochaeta cellobiosiphila]|uniref:bifunctional nuclease family protein n=1 Tax=Spirochaeta cellobiosiphila TaxID=504483 RepID=UPI0004151072|nr:bifunctional nuclease family protein [Spirochaeta cellobiosiphila]
MLVAAEIWTVARTNQGNAVVVKAINTEKAIPILIGNLETQSILIGLGKLKIPRPLTHDLFISLLDQLHVDIQQVEIYKYSNETYYANIVYMCSDEVHKLDCRPSDALSLMVRLKIPLLIESEIFEAQGVEIFTFEEDMQIESHPNKKIMLEEKLKDCVEQEKYEEAAVIRDLLKEIDDLTK